MRTALLALLVLSGCAHSAPETATPAAAEGRVTALFEMEYAHLVLAQIAKQSGANLVYTGSWSSLVSVSLRDTPWRDAVQAVADSCELEVNWERPGIVRVTGR